MSPTRQDQRSGSCPGGFDDAPPLVARPVHEQKGLDRVFENAFPAFGGAYLRRTWRLLDEAIGRSLPMTLAISGPVTVSGQHLVWLNPLLDTGWFALLSTTDAVCYHDGHRALDSADERSFREVPIFGDDGALRDEEVIRVTDVGFPESILLDQDEFLRACLQRPEFQRRMSGTEFRHLLGRCYAEQERKREVPEGLLALCTRKDIPIFVGAPGDGSVFLNSMRLWAEAQIGGAPHAFELDVHAEVFESCAYHRWGIRDSDTKVLGTLILGGGVPKNFNLQPEPALSQIFGFENVEGYLYDIQITTAPVTDGSLSSCPPGEAVTWGKVDREHYRQTTESLPADYSMVMPFLVRALLEKRARFTRLLDELGRETLFERHPEARGYLRPEAGYQLFARRAELVEKLFADLRELSGGKGP
ncbi:MAG TPA: deoxyhypusine synthase family protein [Planctomycetota bacterium]